MLFPLWTEIRGRGPPPRQCLCPCFGFTVTRLEAIAHSVRCPIAQPSLRGDQAPFVFKWLIDFYSITKTAMASFGPRFLLRVGPELHDPGLRVNTVFEVFIRLSRDFLSKVLLKPVRFFDRLLLPRYVRYLPKSLCAQFN